MDKSIYSTQVMSDFNSAYNISSKPIYQPTTYIPISSSTTFSIFSNRPSSPLFHRCTSPPLRRPIPTTSIPKFNFDLYKMDEYNDNSSFSYRSISPLSSKIIYHHPLHSPLSSPTSKTQTLSKLKQINNELCHTLAQSDITNSLQQSPPHYHIHHYPLSQHSHKTYRSRSISEERSSSIEIESPKTRKARITYKIHIPREQHQPEHRKSPHHRSTSNIYSNDDTITVDLYPTQDQDSMKHRRKHHDNQSPWIVNGTSLRRNSYSETSTSPTFKGPYYGDKPIKQHHRSARGKNRQLSNSHHQASSNRPDSAPLYASDSFQESNDSFSNSTSVRRANSSIKQIKFIDSHHKSSSSKLRQSIWHPPSKNISQRPPKYFESSWKSEYDTSTREHNIIGTESEPVSQRKSLSNRTTIRTDDPKFRKRIKNTESKVKSIWEPTINRLSPTTIKEPKPPIPHPIEKTTSTSSPKTKDKSNPSEPTVPTKKVITPPPTITNTNRNSLNGGPTKPIIESTTKKVNFHNESNDSDNESHTSEQTKKQELPHPLPQIEKTPTPPPKRPIPERKVPSPPKKSTNKTNESSGDDDRDENDEEVARNFNMKKWLNDAENAIFGPSEKDNIIIPSIPSRPVQPKSKPKSPPRRKVEPPSPELESPDHNLYKPPFGPKKNDQKPTIPPPPPPPPAATTTTTEGDTNDVDDFFN